MLMMNCNFVQKRTLMDGYRPASSGLLNTVFPPFDAPAKMKVGMRHIYLWYIYLWYTGTSVTINYGTINVFTLSEGSNLNVNGG